jgi:hypothetical protein
MAAVVEQKVRESMTNLVGLFFEKTKPNLGSREKVDGWIKLTENRWLILEVEDGQKHPTTNVAKLWRFLDGNPDTSIILAHVYFPDSKAIKSSRGELAFWIGNQIETLLTGRFYYRRLTIDRKYSEWTGDKELLEVISFLNG